MRKESEDKQLVYKSMVKRANEFKLFYCESMQALLRQLEQHEEERIDMLKAAADKVIVYETSQDLNNKYDAKVFAKVVDSINADKQIKFFRSKASLLRVIDRLMKFR